MRYFNEYAFQQTIQMLNQERLANGEPVITTTRARALHKSFLDELNRMANDGRVVIPEGKQLLDVVKPVPFRDAMNTTLFAENGNRPVFEGKAGEDTYAEFVSEFRNITGWGTNGAVKNPKLPLSPYDERFASRMVFLQNGSRLLYARENELDGQLVDDNTFDAKLPLFRLDEEDKLHRVGTALSQDDISGMSRLMPYISAADYRNVVDWMNQPSSENVNSAMSPAALDRACAVLQHLQEKGWSYTIERDELPGELKARLNGTKISVRIASPRRDEQFIGRVYNDGMSVYYTTNKKDAASSNKFKLLPYSRPTTEDCLKLIDFAMGESIQRTDVNRPVGQVGTYKGRGGVTYNSVYYTKEGYSAVVGTYPGGVGADGKPVPPDSSSYVLLHLKNDRSATTTYFGNPNDATAYLESAVTSARDNFKAAIDLDMLVREAQEHAGEDGYMPAFVGDNGIRAIQQSYWEVLTGKQANLLRPGLERDDFTEADDSEKPEMTYEGTPEEIVRQHLSENADYLIGRFDPDIDGKRFDPVNVATYMSSPYGSYRNNDDIVAALRMAGIKADELKGNDFYNKTVQDKLIKFDPATARPMDEHTSPFVRHMYETIRTSLRETGCTVEDKAILFDANGVVHYRASRATGEKYKAGSMEAFEGEIGQIFVPDDKGMVQTNFAGTDNYIFVPGYEAHVIPQKPGENKAMEERTRLRGYEQIMSESLSRQIRQDVMLNIGTNRPVGSPTGVNSTYRRLYDSRHPLDFVEQARLDGMSQEWIDAIVKTEAMRVKYGNEYKEATASAEYLASIDDGVSDPANDNFQSVYDLVGRKNMGVIWSSSKGYFDKVYTGTATNQGIVRFMVEGSYVTPEGEIIPSVDPNARTPLAAQAGAFGDFDAADRNQMTGSNLMQASSVADGIHVAQMTVGGWTFDDGYVVSKEFAENNRIRGVGGVRRDLMKGDKISDMHGNKGVISIVVDPDMDPAEAEKQGISDLVKIFHDNKGKLDVIGAPFSGVSRFNAGSGRELMQEAHDLVMPDGSVREGCIGTERIIITHLPVDEKTHIYGEDELAQGKGRKASAQLAWALAAQGCDKVLQECYGSNNGSWTNVRELMITMGLDMSETGVLRSHYVPHAVGDGKEDRNVFNMVPLEFKTSAKTNTTTLDVASMRRKFGDIIARSGGFLEIPFELKYQTGDVSNWRPMDMLSSDKRSDPSKPSWAMPVLSAYLRSGQEFEDGTSSVHDYTNQYLRIYEQTLKYRNLESGGGKADMSDAERKKLMDECQKTAQKEYNKITRDLETRKFSGKHNVFRDDLMANRMPHSATAVWTADPRLNIDQLGMGEAMAQSLGVKDGDYVLTWRDPVLRDGGVRYLQVKMDDTLTGVSINPVMDKSYDGDFDGDSIGVCRLQSKAAQRQAMEKLSVGANLLDYSSKNDKGEYALYINDGLDMKSAQYANPVLGTRLAGLKAEINQFEAANRNGRIDAADLAKKRASAVERLSKCVTDTFEQSYGTDMICFKDTKSHLASLEHMVVSGAKGSYGKLKDYATYMGVTYDRVPESVNPAQPLDLDTVKDHGKTLITDQDIQKTQVATDIKKDIGIPGMYSQRAISVLRNQCAKAALEVTYPATQSLLQIKHDPDRGEVIYAGLMGPARDLWRGYKQEPSETQSGKPTWKKVVDSDGKLVQATPAEFKAQFMDIYTSDHGLGVKINPEFVDEIAKAMTNPETGRMMNIERDARDRCAAPLDRLAYGGTFKDLQDMALRGANLTEGQWNQHFVPTTIKTNEIYEEVGLAKKGLVKSDTQAGKARNVSGKTLVQTVDFSKSVTKTAVETNMAQTTPQTAASVNHAAKRELPEVPASAMTGEMATQFGE